MMYLTYDEYQAYGGEDANAAFSRAEYRAEKDIDRYTFDRIKEMTVVPEEVKRLIFELIDYYDSPICAGVSSESVDGWSRSYATQTDAALGDLIRVYLSDVCDDYGTPVLYCGVI